MDERWTWTGAAVLSLVMMAAALPGLAAAVITISAAFTLLERSVDQASRPRLASDLIDDLLQRLTWIDPSERGSLVSRLPLTVLGPLSGVLFLGAFRIRPESTGAALLVALAVTLPAWRSTWAVGVDRANAALAVEARSGPAV